MGESMVVMCPLCGGKLTDIHADGGEPYAPGRPPAVAAAGWGCWGAVTCGPRGCGARGRYGGGGPIANEPDSARLGEMCGRLFDALAATSDRGRVECLVGCVNSLRMENLDIMEGGGDDGEQYWASDHRRFEEDMAAAAGILAAPIAGHAGS